ncbi:hypothetical protein B296_00021022 [Ensete ventricosum]|uniref:Uncharacterized protein n=1 Tax=Ensete ventricosum TaxID=4639 RepID=A0A426Y266_ENSVE|nr:hypothetical protein B296_00021022 [Ensete ventricosum]
MGVVPAGVAPAGDCLCSLAADCCPPSTTLSQASRGQLPLACILYRRLATALLWIGRARPILQAVQAAVVSPFAGDLGCGWPTLQGAWSWPATPFLAAFAAKIQQEHIK